MPWCPKCKTEYKEGIQTCTDCGCELVSEQPEMTDYVDLTVLATKDLAEKLSQYLSYSNIKNHYIFDTEEDAHKVQVASDELEKAKKAFAAFYMVEAQNKKETQSIEEDAVTESEEEETSSNDSNFSMYETKGNKAKELRSTAIIFLLFGIAGLVVVILNGIGVLHIFNSPLQYLLLTAMFIGFLLVAINSIHASKKAAEDSVKEEKLTNDILAYLNATIDQAAILKMKDPQQSEEANVIRILDGIRYAIVTQFGELNEAYLDYIAEEYYSSFESMMNS